MVRPGICMLDDQRWLVEFDFNGDRIEIAYVWLPLNGGMAMIVDWNLTEDAGERLPLSVSVFDTLPCALMFAMFAAIENDARTLVE